MPSWLEILANLSYLASVALAARNRAATWPVGILGCGLFAVLFFQNQLYADVTLQGFFVFTSVVGWWHWHRGASPEAARIQVTPHRKLLAYAVIAICVAFAYAFVLHTLTDAFAPWIDSLVLTLSVVAQLLLMRRRIETWWFWLAVNTLAVPLFAWRGLQLTAVIYTLFWFNALYGWWHWRRVLQREDA
ncbi:MAG: nicotinamide riboside transporter PnuC [Hydrogenophaga sp.]|uniref:nicotinamide riboside transporter PnuC n=1 Tax=Hydrogenophaga sp. TaxID=1904254 RepID=UPI002633BF23|nr:nicotinamide riboside transporter PnuC [Hydrogenophaga sp.]MDM7941191.1 nicotinamide riboside transporter PnuC [Hydrogenophaga sp.]